MSAFCDWLQAVKNPIGCFAKFLTDKKHRRFSSCASFFVPVNFAKVTIAILSRLQSFAQLFKKLQEHRFKAKCFHKSLIAWILNQAQDDAGLSFYYEH